MKAQCPPCPNDISPVHACDWVHPPSCPITFNGPGGCTCTLDYCYRILYGYPYHDSVTDETTIQSSVISFSTDCDSMFQAVVDSASNVAFTDAATNLHIVVPCNDGHHYLFGEAYIASCWKLVQTSPNAFVSCNASAGAYCETKCDICQSSGLKFNCINIEVGTANCAGGPAPTAFANWSIDTCYHPICGTHLH